MNFCGMIDYFRVSGTVGRRDIIALRSDFGKVTFVHWGTKSTAKLREWNQLQLLFVVRVSLREVPGRF